MTYNDIVFLVKTISESVNPNGSFFHGRTYDVTLEYGAKFPQIHLYPFTQNVEPANNSIIRTDLIIGFWEEDSHSNSKEERQAIIDNMSQLSLLFETGIRSINQAQILSFRREPQYLTQMGVASGVLCQVSIHTIVGCEPPVIIPIAFPTFGDAVRGTLLSGVDVNIGGDITEEDTILIAFGKLQNQLDNLPIQNPLEVQLDGLNVDLTGDIIADDTIIEAFGKLQNQLDNLPIQNPLNVQLDGLDVGLDGDVTEEDTILEAFGKLQNSATLQAEFIQDLEDNKVNKSGDTMTGDLVMDESSINSANSVSFNTAPDTPEISEIGKLHWNDIDGTLDLGLKGGNVKLQIGQKEVARVVNKTNPNVNLLRSNYQVVKIVGATGQRLSVALAQANNDLNSASTLGVVIENINNNQEGFIITGGPVTEINTTGSMQSESWSDGDVLYLSPTIAGRLTKVKPIAPEHMVIVGYVEYAHSVHGKIFIKVDNGYELDELHNVKIQSPQDGEALIYNQALGVWQNAPINPFISAYSGM
jgi:hypothetical protein